MFPNTSAVGAYFDLSQHIELYDIDAAMMKTALTSDDAMQKLRVLPTLFHELRHWLDHVATLWGQYSLVTEFNAIHSRLADDESQMWRITAYRKATRRDRFGSYFTTINDRTPPPAGHGRWTSQLSCGVGFDDDGKPDESRPIVFTRFNWEDGRLPATLSCGG